MVGAEYHPELRCKTVAQICAYELGEMLVATVARGPGMSRHQVRRTQGLTCQGERGVKIGFADAISSPNESFLSLLRGLGHQSR